MMKSRFLERLEASIAAGTDELAIDCLRAEKAAYLARLGSFDESRQILKELGHKNRPRPNVELSIYLNFAQGILSFYSDMGSGACDRFLRARALSEAAGLYVLQSNASAWLAHIAFGRHDFQTMANELESALALVNRSSHGCLARVSLVIAQAFHLAAHNNATLWYYRARKHALETGDETIISALIHNMTAIEVAGARQEVLQWNRPMKLASFGVLGAESTINYDKLTGVESLSLLTPVLRAQALSLAERFEEALELYSQYLLPSLLQGMGKVECWLLADRAWCNARLGRLEAAAIDASKSSTLLSKSTQIDDAAATHRRLAQVFCFIGDNELVTHHNAVSNELWLEYNFLQESIILCLRGLEERYILIQ